MKPMILKMWMYMRWPLLALVALYIGLVIYRIPAVTEQQRTQEVVSKIHAQKITLDDVMGKNVPPVPDPTQNNATVAGVDANHNGIRDDVELAIFKNYPNSAKIRAAELQYALALQVEITSVYNTDTWIAAAEEDDRGYQCIAALYPRTNLSKHLQMTELHSKEVENLVFNTQARKDAFSKASQFTTSYGLDDTNYCQIDSSALPD